MKVEITKEEVGVLSNEVIDSLNKSTSFQEYRRNLVKLSAMTPFALYFGLNIFAPTQAKAFFPLLFGFLARTVVSTTVRSVARGAIRGVIGAGSRAGVSRIGASLVTIGGVTMTKAQAQARRAKFAHLGNEIADLALEKGVESVWLKNEENPAQINIENQTDEILTSDVFAKVKDTESNKIVYEDWVGVVKIEPYSKIKIELLISDLPFDGINILTGEASNGNCKPSGKILIV